MLKLPGHGRYAYSPITKRTDYTWPGGKRKVIEAPKVDQLLKITEDTE